jgi:hypothetical protein
MKFSLALPAVVPAERHGRFPRRERRSWLPYPPCPSSLMPIMTQSSKGHLGSTFRWGMNTHRRSLILTIWLMHPMISHLHMKIYPYIQAYVRVCLEICPMPMVYHQFPRHSNVGGIPHFRDIHIIWCLKLIHICHHYPWVKASFLMVQSRFFTSFWWLMINGCLKWVLDGYPSVVPGRTQPLQGRCHRSVPP